MGYNNGSYIQKPVGVPADVPAALGTTKTDWGELCTHPNINKWAWYKPINISKIGIVTESERQVAHYGLTPVANGSILSMLRQDNNQNHDYDTEFATCKANMQEWIYMKPTTHYRITDFVESPKAGEGRGSNGATTNFGYFPSTPPPIRFGNLWSIGKSGLSNVANNIVVETGGTNGQWYAKPFTNTGSGSIGTGNAVKGTYCYEGLQYQDYAARFGSASNQNINMNNSSVIPLNYILSSGTITSENWRLGLIVKVPGISGSSVFPDAYASVFFSQYALSSLDANIASNVLKYSIDMCTNQFLAYRMLAYVEAKGSTAFECIPIVAKINMATIQGGGTSARTSQLFNGSNAYFYSLPTGDKDFTIMVDGGETPAPSGNASKTVGNWTIISVPTGIYTGNSSTPSSQRYPINNIIVYWSGSGSPSSGTTYNVNTSFFWQMYDGSISTGYYNNPNIGIGGSETIVLPNNTTYNGKYGRIIYGGPNLVMPDQSQISLTVTS